MGWFGSSAPEAPAKTTDSSKSEFLEDPFADPFAEDDEGAAFGSISLPPPTPDFIAEKYEPSSDEPKGKAPSASLNQLLGVNPNAMKAVGAVARPQKSAKEGAYLNFHRRSVYERTMYTAGCAYLAGEH